MSPVLAKKPKPEPLDLSRQLPLEAEERRYADLEANSTRSAPRAGPSRADCWRPDGDRQKRHRQAVDGPEHRSRDDATHHARHEAKNAARVFDEAGLGCRVKTSRPDRRRTSPGGSAG